MFTVGSLFSGIGGLDLGLQRAGFQIAWQVENDEFCQKVLAKHWPNVARFRDVRTVGRDTLARVDLIAGGFPCQPHSLAGQRKASEDERNLWPEFARIIRELAPRWILAENVMGLLSSEDGHFFGTVLGDLAQSGYDAEWCVLRASDMGAPHQRERIFLVAHASSERRPSIRNGLSAREDNTASTPSTTEMAHTNSVRESSQKNTLAGRQRSTSEPAGICKWRDSTVGVGLADAHRSRLQERNGYKSETRPLTTIDRRSTRQFESFLGRMPDGFSRRLDGYRWPAGPGPQHDWEPPRVITERQSNRAARLKTLGNAVVPQLAEYIGLCILERMGT